MIFKNCHFKLFGVKKLKFLFHINDYYCIAQDAVPTCLVKKNIHWVVLEYFTHLLWSFNSSSQFTVTKATTLNPCRYCVPPEHGKRFERLAKGKTEVKYLLLIFTIKVFQLS